ncbi:MAG: DUF1611 domain-containing protein [Pseudomonadota bacterium]
MGHSAIDLKPPYLVFVGDEGRTAYAKTAIGLVQWRRDQCLAQLRLSDSGADLGLPDMTCAEAASRGAKSFVIGSATVGGIIPDAWRPVLIEAAQAGLDVVAGLHVRLGDDEALRKAAEESGVRLIDVRVPPADLPIASGKKRPGRRLLTVGTDCALGKKYTALQLEQDMRAVGLSTDFRASGQTGIMIAGQGIPIDAVVSDFVTGAAELLSPDNEPDHWDVIEGQGAIFHPAYGAVSHGLLVGSQPDAVVVCHAAERTHVASWPDFPLPSIGDVIERCLDIGRVTNPDIRCVGISANTSALSDEAREDYLGRVSDEYGLPCVDPMISGTGPIVSRLKHDFP